MRLYLFFYWFYYRHAALLGLTFNSPPYCWPSVSIIACATQAPVLKHPCSR